MNPKRQNEIDNTLNKLLYQFNDKIISRCTNTEEATYALCVFNHHMMAMLFKVINANMPLQEAKAAYKVALDTVLLDYGMSVAIHEFNG